MVRRQRRCVAHVDWIADFRPDLFDRVWQDVGTIVAVKPREAFLRYFQAADELARRRDKKRGVKERERRGSIREFKPHEIEIRFGDID